MNNLIIVVILAVFGFANGQQGQQCIHTKLVTPCHFFKTDEVLGKWYIYEMYSGLTVDATPFQFKCLELNISRNSTTNPKILAAEEKFFSFETGVTESSWDDIVIDDALPLEAIWKLASATPGGQIETADAVWLHTDYENWAIQFGCHVTNNYRYESLSILSRTRNIDPKTLDILRTLASGYGFPAQNLRPINQVGCE